MRRFPRGCPTFADGPGREHIVGEMRQEFLIMALDLFDHRLFNFQPLFESRFPVIEEAVVFLIRHQRAEVEFGDVGRGIAKTLCACEDRNHRVVVTIREGVELMVVAA